MLRSEDAQIGRRTDRQLRPQDAATPRPSDLLEPVNGAQSPLLFPSRTTH